jgi:diguanylate cyclase (GGDEF)-like protein/PAS domain S-box-containing protein
MTGSSDQPVRAAAATLSMSRQEPAAPRAVHSADDALLSLAACHDLALDVSNMATFELDATSGTLSWSTTASDVLGCEDVEVERHLRDLLAPVAAAPAALPAEFELEHSITTGAGEERHVQLRARSSAAAINAGREGIVGAVIDVTDRYRAERELVDLIDRYRLLVELSPDAIVVHEGGIIRYANTAAARFARTTPEAMVGTSIVQFVDASEIEVTLSRIMGLTESGMVSEPAVATLVALDGTHVRMESVSVRTTWEGRPAFQVIMRDTSERDRAEAVLRAQADLVAAVSDAIVALDDDNVITSWNPAAERIFGWSAQQAVGSRLSDLAEPFIITGGGHIRDSLADAGLWAGELTMACRNGSSVPVYASLAPMAADADGSFGIVAVCSDQSQRRAAEAERARAEARFSTVVAALDEGIAVVGVDGQVQSLNEAAERILGRTAHDVAAGIFTGAGFDACGEDGRALDIDAWPVQLALERSGPVIDRTVGIRRPDGTHAWLRMSVHPLAVDTDGPEASAVVCSFSDITEERRSAGEMAYAAAHDALTGLPNRVAMRAELDGALALSEDGEPRPPVAVLFCDLDRFKDVNDSLGHHVGDTVLCEVADRLRQIVPGGVSIGRLGGDEFVVVGAGLSRAAAVDLAHLIVMELEQPLQIEVHAATMTVFLGASVGVAFSDQCAAPVNGGSDVLRAADVALYRAKARGRNRIEVFDPSMRDPARLRFEMREDLRVAIETEKLEVHYQPLWRTASEPGGCTVAGFEALVRWNHPTRGRQNPAEFVALAEDTGLISALGAYVLERACHQTAAWRAEGHDVYVSVNLSARQLSDPDLVPLVAATMARAGLPAQALWLELTESALADDAVDAAAVLRGLVALGVRMSIDDFGTGYSSLGRLRHLPVAALKVDQSFVADMTPSSARDGVGDGGTIVESTIALAHRLGLAVIAEGVETVEQLRGLAGLDCDLLQGFLLGRPVAAADVSFTPAGC